MTKIGLIFVLLLLSLSCRKLEEYPIIPAISYNGFELLINSESGISEQGVLYISYTDGDGDIGLDQSDTGYPYHSGGSYYYNFFITYYECDHGVFTEVPLLSWNNTTQEYDTLTFNARIPVLLPKEKKQGIKGVIRNEMFIYNPLAKSDTIQFKVKIIDRALHFSNEITTPPIVLVKDTASNMKTGFIQNHLK
jgi:hypothetical protein